MKLLDFIEAVAQEQLTMTQKKILTVVGSGGMTRRMRDYGERFKEIDWDLYFASVDQIHGKSADLIILDDQDFSELELRTLKAVITGHSHPEMFGFYESFQFVPQPKQPAPKPKKNTGPRNRWGGLK